MSPGPGCFQELVVPHLAVGWRGIVLLKAGRQLLWRLLLLPTWAWLGVAVAGLSWRALLL